MDEGGKEEYIHLKSLDNEVELVESTLPKKQAPAPDDMGPGGEGAEGQYMRDGDGHEGHDSPGERHMYHHDGMSPEQQYEYSHSQGGSFSGGGDGGGGGHSPRTSFPRRPWGSSAASESLHESFEGMNSHSNKGFRATPGYPPHDFHAGFDNEGPLFDPRLHGEAADILSYMPDGPLGESGEDEGSMRRTNNTLAHPGAGVEGNENGYFLPPHSSISTYAPEGSTASYPTEVDDPMPNHQGLT